MEEWSHHHESLNETFIDIGKHKIRKIALSKIGQEWQSSPETIKIRNKIIDWLIIIHKRYNLSDRTFITSIDLFDLTIYNYNYQLSTDEYHLIAITCMFISSKIYENTPLTLEDLVIGVSKDKFCEKDIISTEILILKKINFHIPKNYFIDIATNILHLILPKSCSRTLSNIIFKSMKDTYKIFLFDINNSICNKDNHVTNYISIIYSALINVKQFLERLNPMEIISKLNLLIKKFQLQGKEVIKKSNSLKELKEIIFLYKEGYPFIYEEYNSTFSPKPKILKTNSFQASIQA
jgi:hypothetical protein